MRVMGRSRSTGLGLAAVVVLAANVGLSGAEPDRAKPRLLFRESFDDDRLTARGWYDGQTFAIARGGPAAGDGCIEYRWKAGTSTPESSSALRRQFEPTETIYVRFAIRLSRG